MKLIYTRKVLYLASFWKWKFSELENGLIIDHSDVALRRLGPYSAEQHHETVLGKKLAAPPSLSIIIRFWETAHLPLP